MPLAYALERRHRGFIALFAIACTLSSVYAFLIGSLPFGAVEALWSVVALQRFRLTRAVNLDGQQPPASARRAGENAAPQAENAAPSP